MPESRWNDREGRFEIDRDHDFIDEPGWGRPPRERYEAHRHGGRRGGEFLRAQAQGGDIGYGRVGSGAGYGPGRDAFHAPGDYGAVGDFDYGVGTDRYGGYARLRPRHDDGRFEERREPRGEPPGEHRGDYGRPYESHRYGGHEERSWFDRARDEVAAWTGDHDAQARRNVDARLGEHRGRGPRNYRRSDERIRDDVNDRLTDDSWLDAGGVEVTVENGEVTLSGQVRSREDKRRAEVIAEGVSGVENVQNNLRAVRPEDAEASRGTGMNGLV
ncbi:MAG: BON domain-containing protein [Caulobacter sp.]|nr:BON domain-containing protein [Caulobacter sp.]